MLQLKKSRGTRAPFAAVTAPDSAELFFLNQGTKWDCTAFISQRQQVAPSVCLMQQASFTHSFPETQPETIPCGTQAAHFDIFSVFLQLNSCLKNSLFFPPINFPTFPVTD